MLSFNVVDSNLAGTYDTVTGKFNLILGPLDSLPVTPGTYYLRFKTTCANQPWNLNGTVVRLTIGAPASQTVIISSTGDSVYCNSSDVTFYQSPYNPNSRYNWISNLFQPFTTYGGINVNLEGSPVNIFQVYVQEDNNGCYGPTSPPFNLSVITLPKDTITGLRQVCKGDSATYHCGFLPSTYYGWKAPAGIQVVLYGSNEATMTFDTTGTFIIADSMANQCGSRISTYQVTVRDLPQISLSDTSICSGSTVTLNAGNTGATYLWQDSSTSQTYHVTSAGTYSVTVTSSAHCKTSDSAFVTTTICLGIENTAANTSIKLYPNPTNGLVNLNIDNATGTALFVQITNAIGQQIGNNRYNNDTHFSATYNISGFANGLYYFKVITDSKVHVFEVNLVK